MINLSELFTEFNQLKRNQEVHQVIDSKIPHEEFVLKLLNMGIFYRVSPSHISLMGTQYDLFIFPHKTTNSDNALYYWNYKERGDVLIATINDVLESTSVPERTLERLIFNLDLFL